MAANKMSVPSMPLEKYSALLWPNAWSLSAGLEATSSMARAMIPPARLTRDSRASESRPTEPVKSHAASFSPMVATAAAMDSQA